MNTREQTALWEGILSLRTPAEAGRFFRDLLTQAEIEDLAKRWQVARMLDASYTYDAIQAKTDLSTTTIARISRWLQTGKGGYRLVLDRLATSHHNAPLAKKGMG